MPSVGITRTIMQHHGHTFNENRCDCCPYGYHIDRDFVPFTKKMLSREREGDFTRLQELKDKWRSERQSMDELLGVPVIHRNWGVETISRASTDIWQSFKTPPVSQSLIITDTQRDSNSNYNLPFGNGLDEAVTDFEEALQRTRPDARVLSFDIPDSQKYHTFPRIKAPVLRDLDSSPNLLGNNNQLVTSKCSSTASSITASTIIMKESSSKRHSVRDLSKQDKKSESDSGTRLDSLYIQDRDTKEKQHNTMSNRLRDLEEQVKLIPELEDKVTQLKEEKRQLLKLLDVQKQNQLNSTVVKNYNNSEIRVSSITSSKNNKDIRSLKSEDSLVGPKPPPRRKTRDAGVGKTILTRDVGVSHTMPRTRSIGVGGSAEFTSSWDRTGGIDSSSPTGSLSGTLRRRVKSFETGVQVNNYDLTDEPSSIPILQIIERKDVGIQASIGTLPAPEPKVSKITLPPGKAIGISAKPTTRDAGYTAKPLCKDSSMNTVQEVEKSSRSVGVTASLAADSLVEDKTKRKPLVKSIAINTEKQRVHTIGINTTEVFDSVSSTSTDLSANGRFQRKSPSPSRTAPASIERSFTYEAKDLGTEAKLSESLSVEISSDKESDRKSALKSSLSLPLQSSQATRQTVTQSYTSTYTQSADTKGLSRIPRLASPLVSPMSSPRTVSKPITISSSGPQTYSPLDDTGSSSSSSISPTSAAVLQYKATSSPTMSSGVKKPGYFRSDTYTKEMHLQSERSSSNVLEPLEEERERPRASTSYGFSSSQENREKATPSKEMQGALKVLNDALLRGRTTQEVTSAISIILHEWFRVAGTKTANPLDVEDYLDVFESYSPQLLRYIVNMPDGNGNTAMHYAVSHGNFDVVSILLDSKVCDPNKANKAGYTSVMLVSLAKVLSDTHRQVVRRLFGLGDVNIKAAQHGQTALMLGASHGRLDTVRLLLEAGADINIQDEDGSTALMCASEHGHGEIVKYLLAQPDCDPHITDNDGSTALTVAMEAGHKDIGVMLYAHMHFVKAPSSPYSSGMLRRSRSTTPRSTPSSKSNSPITSAQTSPIASKKQHSLNYQ